MSDEARAYPLELALYIEGVRVPFVSATVSSKVGGPSSCVIELPPFSAATRIRPRSMVQIFYLDVPFIAPSSNPGTEQWRLLFEGEYSHVNVSQDQDHRSVSIICQDYTNYWFHTYQYYINNYKSIVSSTIEMAAFVNAADARDPDSAIALATIYNTDVIGSVGNFVMNTVLLGRNNIIVGLMDLIAKIGGEASRPQTGATKPVNQFFAKAEARLRMARRAFYIPDKELSKLLNIEVGTAALNVMQQFGGMVNHQASVYEIIQKFLAHANYTFVSFLAPPFGTNPSRDIDKDGNVSDTVPKSIPDNTGQKMVLNTMFKPSTIFSTPPKCNILFPNRISKFSYSRSFLDEPTRYRMVVDTVSSLGVRFTGPGDSDQEFVVYAPPVANVGNPNNLQAEAAASLLCQKIYIDPTTTTFNKTSPSGSLTTAWFAILRDYGNYPNGSNLIFDTSRDISELECGIVPTGEKLDQNQAFYINQLALRETGNEVAADFTSIQDRIASYLPTKTTDTYSRLRYLVQTADYKLDSIKYAYRTVEGISGPFNPNLLVGFPAVLLSNTVIIVGELASVNHRMSAIGGAVTECRMTHASSFPTPAFVGNMTDAQLTSFIQALGNNPENALNVNPVTGEDCNRYLDPRTGDKVSIKDRDPDDFPPFINSNFNPDNITNIYSSIFGTESIYNIDASIDANGSSFDFALSGAGRDRFVAGLIYYLQYLKAIDKEQYVNSVTQRNITSIANYGDHFNLVTSTPVSQDQWSDRPVGFLDELLFGGAGIGPVFKDYNTNSIATKQPEVQKLTKDMRIAIGKEPFANNAYDYSLKRSGGASSGE